MSMHRAAAALALGGAAVLGAAQEPPGPPAGLTPGKPAPAFRLTDTSGQERTLAECKGKIVVLEWTDPRCVLVRQCYRTRAMQTAWRATRELDGSLVWLAINSTAGAASQENDFWIRQNALAYPILLDGDGEVATLYGVRKSPTMFVIDREGVLRYHGAIDNNKFLDRAGDELVNYVVEAVKALVAGEAVEIEHEPAYGCLVKKVSG